MAEEKETLMGECKDCGSSLPEEYLRRNHGLCPICYTQQKEKREGG